MGRILVLGGVMVLVGLATITGFLSLLAPAGVWYIRRRMGRTKAWAVWFSALIGAAIGLPWQALFDSELRGIFWFSALLLGSLLMLTAWQLWDPLSSRSTGERLLALFAVSATVVLGPVLLLYKEIAQPFGEVLDLFREQWKASTGVEALGHESLFLAFLVNLPLVVLVFVGLAKGLGNRLARRREALDLTSFHLPTLMVWAFSLSLAGVLAVWKLKLPVEIAIVVPSVGLLVAVVFAIQGLGIVQYWLVKTGRFALARLLVPATCLGMVLVPLANIFILASLSLLGVAETWVAFRGSPQELETKEM